MEWKVRYKIAMGVARGLHYLHKGCQRRIIHRDIKASNVLLTADFEPQVNLCDWSFHAYPWAYLSTAFFSVMFGMGEWVLIIVAYVLALFGGQLLY